MSISYNKGDGIWIDDGPGNVIGGTAANEANALAFNDGCGVRVTGAGAVGNSLHGNIINENGQLGIDLGGDGVTPNDNVPFDPDSGPNSLQNYPVITSATSVGGFTTIKGDLKTRAQQTYLLEFYSSTQKDPSGYGEGLTPIGSTQVSTDAVGTATFSGDIPWGYCWKPDNRDRHGNRQRQHLRIFRRGGFCQWGQQT